jgi:hypothetical protein
MIFLHSNRLFPQLLVKEASAFCAGLLISMIPFDSDSIGDTFEVSLSAMLLGGSIAIAIGDTFSDVSLSIIAILLDSIANIVA